MKDNKLSKMALGSMKNLATASLKRNANQTTCAGVFQPQAPAKLKSFSKLDK